MKNHLHPILPLLILLGLLLAGCNRSTKVALFATDTPTQVFPSVTAAPATPTQPVATALLSATPNPVNTTIPTNTAVPTNTAIPTVSPTPVPPTLTFTPAPSATPAATSTNTPLPRSSADAYYVSKAPKIDGVWDEWTSKQYPITNVGYGRENWSGKADLQASYRVAWDSKYLYLAVKVFDDTYAQNAQGQDIYKGDSIELLVSTSPNADSAALGLIASDYQIGVSPGRPNVGENMEAFRWFPSGKGGSLTNVAIGAVTMSGGYRIEFAIPWSDLGLTPTQGKLLGFTVSVSDNDQTSANVQQTLISSTPYRSLTNPTTWGTLTLK